MSAIYDNWERLVAAVVKKQQLWELFHEQSRSPSILSEASDFSSSFGDLDVDFLSPESSSRSHISSPKLILISDFFPAHFEVEGVAPASTELLGRGTFGSAYLATKDDGQRFVVKRLNSVAISKLDFERNMKIVGDVKHENVVALRAYYFSTDEKLMLYDYYSNGSVHSLLHGQYEAHVDWETRLNIAVGAARGIAEIHRQHGGVLVHGNIKASNIFLNRQRYGCVSDLGLTNMMKTAKIRSTALCYAPEVKNFENVSHASDVYSYGILLLELLIRKPTENVPGGQEAVDIVKLVNSVKSKERAAKVFDADLLKYPAISKQMVKMMQIGMRCVAKSRSERPKMVKVEKMLEDIIALNSASHDLNTLISQGISRWKLVFVEDSYRYPYPTFYYEKIIWASAELLSKGTAGTFYKIRLENGNRIVVKILMRECIEFKEFEEHMELIVRMRHINVAMLKAYYFSRDEVILVYDYYHQTSLSSLLHGWIFAGRRALDWATRVEIAVGAAKGISHIHRQDGGKLVHGNIKSSNIFLYQETGIVSDAGLARLTSPIKLDSVPSSGYYAPEFIGTWNATQASDVYSFGVVLLQLLSGRPPQHTTPKGDVVPLVHWIQYNIQYYKGIYQLIDPKIQRYEPREEMQQFLRLAMDCVSTPPERRPRMAQVVDELEKIRGIKTRLENLPGESRMKDIMTINPIFPGMWGRKLVFVEDAYPTVDFEIMLRASSEVLGKGTVGTCYKATFNNGKRVVVKRLKRESIEFKDFQKHMEFIARLRHTNVVMLKSYYFTRDDMLLVYDYYHQSTLSSLLDDGASSSALDWATRVQIAVSAAKGISHIHTQDGGNLVHGNIKSSNIFLNKQSGIVSDAGLTRLVSPVELHSGYSAPEVGDTWKTTQASDVYSFGVVLLQLISGRPPRHTTTLVQWLQHHIRNKWTAEVIDLELRRYEPMEGLLRFLRLAMDCVSFLPEHRPRMPQVVEELEKIGDSNTLVESGLKCVLEDLLHRLTPQ